MRFLFFVIYIPAIFAVWQQTYFKDSTCTGTPKYSEHLVNLDATCAPRPCEQAPGGQFYQLVTCPEMFQSLGIVRRQYGTSACDGQLTVETTYPFEQCLGKSNYLCQSSTTFILQNFASEGCQGCPTSQETVTHGTCITNGSGYFSYESTSCGNDGSTNSPSPPVSAYRSADASKVGVIGLLLIVTMITMVVFF